MATQLHARRVDIIARLLVAVAGLLLLTVAIQASAQIVANPGDLPGTDRTAENPLRMAPSSGLRQVKAAQKASNINRQTGTYGPIAQTKQSNEAVIPPFGVDLFSGGFRGPQASGLNPSYRILPGDRVTLRVWGAVNINQVLPVDAQGNIFIPYIGPVQVQGVTAGQLNSRIKAAIHQVFTDNVSVYTNLQGVQPVAVFVTGYVQKPGRYAGTPSASVLYFLDQASGIEQASGSYRRILIKRNDDVIATVDLYDFLMRGQLPDVQFESGDTIVVTERGPVITVAGNIARPFKYELAGQARPGQALLELVQLKPGVTHALVNGVRVDGLISAYLTLGKFRDATLRAGDSIYFTADLHAEKIIVQIEGSYKGPSRYVVPEDTMLKQLLNAIPVNPELAATGDVFIRRDSIAKRQKESLQDSLRRLEMTYLGASSATAKAAKIRVQEAQLIQDFVKRASQVEPTGLMVVSNDDTILDVRLEDGDEIVIPEESNTVLLTGEVLVPRAMVYSDDQSAMDYIQRAGGFTQRANEDRILIVRQSGEVLPADSTELKPGDEIMVLPEAPTKNLQLASTLAQIVFQIAIATSTVLDI